MSPPMTGEVDTADLPGELLATPAGHADPNLQDRRPRERAPVLRARLPSIDVSGTLRRPPRTTLRGDDRMPVRVVRR